MCYGVSLESKTNVTWITYVIEQKTKQVIDLVNKIEEENELEINILSIKMRKHDSSIKFKLYLYSFSHKFFHFI